MSANLANIKKWHDALVSGKYDQTTGKLRDDHADDTDDKAYCCLGVACEAAILDGVALEWAGAEYRLKQDVEHLDPEEGCTIWETELPPVVQAWLGVWDENPDLLTEEGTKPAIVLNDTERWTFDQIAKAIRRTWPAAFKEEAR